ncbi:MAG: hypothetical protein HY554_00265, partial [Elusimicrobia bacterium]|nr:hypothetical protein [Elusimicrobiota bacterium]
MQSPIRLASCAALVACLAAHANAEQSFTFAGPLPDAYIGHALLASNGRIYHIGGISGTNGVIDGNRVYFAQAQADGQLGAWTEAEPLPAAVFYHASAEWNGTLYSIGGYRYADSFELSNAVYYSRIQADGRPGAWQRGADLPKSLYLHSAAVWDGVLYVTGGWGDEGLMSGVYSGRIEPNGTIASWTPLAPLPTGVYAHTTVDDGTLYVIGGAVDNGTRVHSEVYYARILADRTLAAWERAAPLPEPIANHVSEVIQGRIWVAGGWTGANAVAAVNSSPILADKSLGAWEAGPALPNALYQHASTVLDDSLYVSGGIDGNGNSRGEVWRLPPPPPAIQP